LAEGRFARAGRTKEMPLPASLANHLELPVVGSPLFIVSGPELVIAQCKVGIVGSFPALNARPVEKLDEWLTRIENELGEYKAQHPTKKVAPYAVNQICHASNDRLMKDMETCVKHRVPIIITSLRPPSEIVEAAHSYGGVVFHDVINVKHARKAAEQGVDGLILVCAGAGGHAGTLSPFALVREVKQWFKGTILLSGAISDGWSIASALALGADLAYIGTRFIATEEANADIRYKQALTEYGAHDIVYSNLFTGVHGNYLGPSIVAAGLDPGNLPVADKSKMNFGSGGNTKAKAWRDIWGSGQGIGQITDTPPVAELVARLKAEFRGRRKRFPAAGARLSRTSTRIKTEGENDAIVAARIGHSVRGGRDHDRGRRQWHEGGDPHRPDPAV
jgi:nitronate monooxygenase